jgi:hypothetical protein
MNKRVWFDVLDLLRRSHIITEADMRAPREYRYSSGQRLLAAIRAWADQSAIAQISEPSLLISDAIAEILTSDRPFSKGESHEDAPH